MEAPRAVKIVEVKHGVVSKVLCSLSLWREFLLHPSETTNEFTDWMRTELAAQNVWITVDEVILEIARRLARIYVWSSGRKRAALRDLDNGIPTPMIVASLRDQTFFHMNLHFSIGTNDYMIELRHFASCLAFKTSEIAYGLPYNTLITAPSNGVELRVGMGMKHGFEPIVDPVARQNRLLQAMVQYGIRERAQIPITHDGFPQDSLAELIHFYFRFVHYVICGRNMEETLYFLQLQSEILRGGRTRMISIFQTGEQQVGKTTILNINYALHVECASVSNAEQLLGKFNQFLLKSLVFCEEFTSDRAKMMEIYQRIKSASTAEIEQIENKNVGAEVVQLCTNVMIARNDSEMPFIEWGDNRTALFACVPYDNKAFFDRLYVLLRDSHQLRALFVWLTIFSDGHSFDGKERPEAMRRRIAAKAYGNSKPIDQIVSNVFCGYAFEPQAPPGIVFAVGNDVQFDQRGFVNYLVRSGACKGEKTAESAVYKAVERGILRSIPSIPGRYTFGDRCKTLFALGIERPAAAGSGAKRAREETDEETEE